MKVLMFGWEFPPYNQGGLGTACHGLTHGLYHHDTEIFFVLPKIPQNISIKEKSIEVINANSFHKKMNPKKMYSHLKTIHINSPLRAYQTDHEYKKHMKKVITEIKENTPKNCQKQENMYGKNLHKEVERYAYKAHIISQKTPHDVIHAHDWMTYPAAEVASDASGKPFIAHVHATEFDRTGGNPNQHIYDMERRGMHRADKIIAVSEFTKQKIIENYGVDPEKIEVVHNAVHYFDEYIQHKPLPQLKKDDKIVLFLGRITLQKGPDYFIDMAAKVLQKKQNVKFVMAGSGDMMDYIIHKASKHKIIDKILFTGFLKGPEIDRVYQHADIYVMPSISEPFGITPLEAIKNGTPVLISHQSGVSEIITNALKVHFWDVDDMANKVLSVLNYKTLTQTLVRNSQYELSNICWKKQAKKVKNVYEKTLKTLKNKQKNISLT